MGLAPLGNTVGRFEASNIARGRSVGAPSALSRLKQVFSSKDQLAVFNPSRHQHIASGVSKTQLSTLIQLNPAKGFSSTDLDHAGKILTAAGIAHGHLDAGETIRLAVMTAGDPQRAADTAQLKSVGLALPQTVPPEIRHGLAELSRADPPAATAVAGMVAAGTDVTSFLDDLVDIASHSPKLAGKIGGVSAGEVAGTAKAGSTAYIVSRAKSDPYMRDHASGLNPASLPTRQALGFDPKFHVNLSPEKFEAASAALTRLQGEGLFTAMRADAGTGTIHSGYTHQTFSDVAQGLGKRAPRGDGTLAKADADVIKSAFRSGADGKAPLNMNEGHRQERAFGNPAYSDQRQNTRFDAVLGMFQSYSGFVYAQHDAKFTDRALTQLQTDVTGKPNRDKFTEIFKAADGFCIGENHSDGATKKFLHDNLAELKAQGVTVIAVEHLKHHEFATMIDDYMQTPPGTPMGEDLRWALTNIDRNMTGAESISALVRKVHDDPACRGIKLIASDTENMNASEGLHGYEMRMGSPNVFAEGNIRSNLQPGEKFVILAGAAHNNTHVGLDHGMPGFSQVFGIPAFTVAADGAGGFDMTVDREDKTARTAATDLRPNNDA